MKHVLSNNITSTAKQPIVKETLAHYDNQLTEVVNALCRGQHNNGPFIVYGCEWTYSGGVFSVNAGAIFSSGELYLVDAYSATISMPSRFYGSIVTSYESIDPILFTDGNSYNVHQTKRIVWNNTSGSYDLLTIHRRTDGWLTKTITDAMLTVNTGSITVASATKKEFTYKYDFFTNTLIVNYNIVSADASASSFANLYIDISSLIPSTLSSNDMQSIGYYNNSYNTSSAGSGLTKRSSTYVSYSGGSGVLTITPAVYLNFDADGSNNLTFQGQIEINI